ncbi:class III lanthionine synthetase LanKC [Kitasatospora sp. NPDC088391]|uniref:class III lanthionine synthetase LanKC n=1 Tax=Kitasatospora sp. NPDC088391 TaxID=3364074 RepID=UPI0038260E0B
MRDERWVHRFLFTWNDTLFFDPLDVYYEPRADHFLSSLDERQRARFVRSGIWWSHRHDPDLPAQGWKIHVSANHREVREVAALVVGHLTARGSDFKIALDLNIFEMLNSKGMARGSGGKLVTVYPRDEDDFRTLLAELAALLDGREGAYVLSDVRYRESKSLYFRYGQFLRTHRLDVLGRQVAQIAGPDGPTADDREPGFAQPSWQSWPFDDWKPAEEGPEEGDGLLGGRFRVTGAIQFSNSGGVYTAEDTADGDRQVVLKEARPHTNPNTRLGHDALNILDREWTFLNRLAGSGCFAAPIARFDAWEHRFIAQEFVPGTDIRSVLLERNPLARPVITADGAREFLRIFLAVLGGLSRAVGAAHEHGVVLGDLSPSNLLVDPDTFHVTVIDLEACRLADPQGADGDEELAQPVDLYTPGFSHSEGRSGPPGPADDLRALANTMAYFVFPIAAMSYLRPDVLGLFRTFTDALGWPPEVHGLLMDLARGRAALPEVFALVARTDELLGAVRAVTPAPVDVPALGLAAAESGVAAFAAAAADPGRATLFPTDPFAHVTNPLSLGFGASGVLWALHASGVPVRPEWRQWLGERLDGLDPDAYPDGLMNGLAGIAWTADTLGFPDRARELLELANRRGPAVGDHTFYYGLAGLGLTDLRFHLRHGGREHLAAAVRCARVLCDSVEREGRHAFWRNEFSPERPLTGLGFGQAGVALFLLRMHQATGEEHYRQLGRAALDWELDHATLLDEGVVMFDHEGTMEPYVEVGSAGIAQVLLRYGDLDAARRVLRAVRVGQSVLPGYGFGMSGIADAMLDAAAFTGDPSYRDTALRQLDFVRRVFLFEPAERFGMPRRDGVAPLGVPGEGLLRCSTDYLTGSAGVLRVLHRANSGGGADFLLDELPNGVAR